MLRLVAVARSTSQFLPGRPLTSSVAQFARATTVWGGNTDMADVAIEHPTSTGLDSRKLAMWAFLASDCMFFGSLIATYMVSKYRSVTGPYPQDLINIPFTSVSSFVLLMSSLAMVLALAGIQRG